MRPFVGYSCFVVVLFILIARCVQTPTSSTNGTSTIPVGTTDPIVAKPSSTSTLGAIGTSLAPVSTPPARATPIPVQTSKTGTIVEPSIFITATTSSNALISFVEVPPRGSDAPVRGTAKVDNTDRYRVIVYLRVDGAWWGPKPYWDQPLTIIAPNGEWSTEIVTGGDDKQAREVTAYLVPASFSPPTMNGDAVLPAVLDQFPHANAER